MKLFTPVESQFNRFTGSGGGGKLPPPPAPSPTPEDIDIQSLQKGEAERRRLTAQRGRRSTILTEAPLETNKKSLLG
jgi:hypothetical protein